MPASQAGRRRFESGRPLQDPAGYGSPRGRLTCFCSETDYHPATMLTRRRLLAGTLATIATSVAAEAQQAGRPVRIGSLGSGTPDALRQGLRKAGYVEGPNLVIEWRDAGGKPERFDGLAAELVRLKVDVIVVANPAAALAAKRATAS